jgi:hypothetical protein
VNPPARIVEQADTEPLEEDVELVDVEEVEDVELVDAEEVEDVELVDVEEVVLVDVEELVLVDVEELALVDVVSPSADSEDRAPQAVTVSTPTNTVPTAGRPIQSSITRILRPPAEPRQARGARRLLRGVAPVAALGYRQRVLVHHGL